MTRKRGNIRAMEDIDGRVCEGSFRCEQRMEVLLFNF